MKLEDLKPTQVFSTYWWFASERYAMCERRLAGQPPPWTSDPDLQRHRFTNVFRVTDRVSQYLLTDVIYNANASAADDETVFRIILFKIFNQIQTWEMLHSGLRGIPEWSSFNLKDSSQILDAAQGRKDRIWNPAYIMRPQVGDEKIDANSKSKHWAWLALLEKMMQQGLPQRLKAAKTYEEAYNALRRPAIGPFLSMQWLTDLNYSPVIDFDENDFIRAGDGAMSGIRKCFVLEKSPSEEEAAAIIGMLQSGQEGFFRHYGLQPVRLRGQLPMSLIDCQNVFCETDKISRRKHPDIKDKLGRTKIKQGYDPGSAEALRPPFFPPKWGIK